MYAWSAERNNQNGKEGAERFFHRHHRSENGVQGKQLRLAAELAQGKLRDAVQNKPLKHGGTEAAEGEFKSFIYLRILDSETFRTGSTAQYFRKKRDGEN
jgi:hypothetical protein